MAAGLVVPGAEIGRVWDEEGAAEEREDGRAEVLAGVLETGD
jgi:hypothetical protein